MRVLVYKGIFSRFILDHFILLEFLTMHQMVDDTRNMVWWPFGFLSASLNQ